MNGPVKTVDVPSDSVCKSHPGPRCAAIPRAICHFTSNYFARYLVKRVLRHSNVTAGREYYQRVTLVSSTETDKTAKGPFHVTTVESERTAWSPRLSRVSH